MTNLTIKQLNFCSIEKPQFAKHDSKMALNNTVPEVPFLKTSDAGSNSLTGVHNVVTMALLFLLLLKHQS